MSPVFYFFFFDGGSAPPPLPTNVNPEFLVGLGRASRRTVGREGSPVRSVGLGAMPKRIV